MANKFWDIKNSADSAEVWIYDQIGSDWFTAGVEAKEFCQELAKLNVRNLDVHINSPGGSVFDGLAIYNALLRHPANVTTYIDGLAASIASVIALAGNRVVMAETALFMIHKPWSCQQGDAEALRKEADLLDKCENSIVSAYTKKSPMDEAAIRAAMADETWMTAEEAQAFGFCDEISTAMKAAASSKRFDLKALGFRRPPEGFSLIESTQPAAPAAATTTAPQAAQMEVVTMETPATAPAHGVRDYQKEAAEIAAMCAASHCPDKTAEFITAGYSPDQAGKAILDMIHAGQVKNIVPAGEALPIVDLGKDAKSYSYAKAIAAGLEMREGRNASGLEVEIHQEIMKKLPSNYESRGGIMVPQRVQNTTLTTTGTYTGKETVFQEYGEFIDILRNMMGTTRMGARILTGLVGPITFPKQTAASTLYWTGENSGSDVTASNVTFGTVTMSPKTCMATGALSRQLIIQSTPDVEGIIRNDLAMIHALGWDLAALHGTGQNSQPLGLYGQSGVNAVAMGGVPTFGKLVDMATAIATYNALFGNTGFLTNPIMAGKLMQTLVASAAGSKMIWEGTHIDGVVAGYKACATNQIKTNLGSGTDEVGILFGNWSDLMIGMWGALELLVDPFSLKKQGLIEITSFQMADVAARRGESFAKATGAKIA